MANDVNKGIEVPIEARLSDKQLKKDIKKVQEDLKKLSRTEIEARISSAKEKKNRYYSNYEQRVREGKANASDRAIKAEENRIKRLQAELDLRDSVAKSQQKTNKSQEEFNQQVANFKKILNDNKVSKEDLSNITKFITSATTGKYMKNNVDTSALPALVSLADKVREELATQEKLDKIAENKVKNQEKLNALLEEYNEMLNSGILLNESDAKIIKRGSHKAQLTGASMGLDASGFVETEAEADRIIEKYRQIGIEWNNLVGQSASKKDQLKLQLEDLNSELGSLQDTFTELRARGEEVTEDFKSEAHQLVKEITKIKKQLQPTFLQKLFATFKRIGFYRLARDFFRIIINTAKEGIKSFASFDDTARQTMSSITGSFDMIKASVGVSLLTVFQTLEPIIRSIAVAFAEVANAISKATAASKGLGVYTKINTDYMKEYGEATKSSLLSFDKFETLSGEDNNLYSKESVNEEEGELDSLGSSIVSMFTSLKDLVTAIWDIIKPVLKILKPIVELVSTLVTLIVDLLKESGLLDALKIVVEFLVNMIVPALEGIVRIVKFIIALFKGDFKTAFGELGEYFKSVGKGIANFFIGILNFIIMGFEKMVNFVVDILNAILAPIKWVLSWFGVEWNGIPKVTLGRIQYMADGGLVEQGSLFVAGEAGAEIVHSSNGTTGVTNIAQFKQAMVEALYECSDLFVGGEGAVVLNLDGAEVARSRRFKAELNRTNSGLNLR